MKPKQQSRKTQMYKRILKFISFCILLASGLGLMCIGIRIVQRDMMNAFGYEPSSSISVKLKRQGKVTKTFKQAGYPTNVVFYDPKTTPDIAKADFDTSEYHRIYFLMYSDGCPHCNQGRDRLRDQVGNLAKKENLVVLINDQQNLKPLRHYFKFPKDYRFPTLFEFEKDTDGNIILIKQKLLL